MDESGSTPATAQEAEGPAPGKLGLARKLASPNKKIRDRAISLLVLWLTSQKQVSEDELKKIWKGLFYCVWHSDKLPVQADLIERLASMAEKLDRGLSLRFFKVFLSTLRREWGGIDKLRLDKFYLLLSKYLIHMFGVVKASDWDANCTKEVMDALLESTFLAEDQYAARGVNFHYAEIFLKELAKFLPLKAETLRLLLRPFLDVLAKSSDKCLMEKVRGNMFDHLLESGRALVTAKREGNDLDPGIELLGSLAFSFPIALEAFEHASAPSTPQFNRKLLYQLHQEFETLEKLLTLSGITISFDCSKKIKRVPKASPLSAKARKLKSKEKRAGKDPLSHSGGSAGNKPSLLFDDKTVGDQVSDGDTERKLCGSGNDVLAEKRKSKQPKKKKISKSESKPNSRVEIRVSFASTEVKKKKRKQKIRESNEHAVDLGPDKDCMSTEKSSRPRKETVDCASESRSEMAISLNPSDPVVSNLRECFDRLASELPNDSQDMFLSPALSNSAAASLGITGSKKRKRASIKSVLSPKVLQENRSLSIDRGAMTGNSTGKAKRVRFSLKNNLEWKPHSPLPPEDLRVPPSAIPRGSALKKGVPPGPIVVEKLFLKQRKGTPRRVLSQSNPRRSKKQNRQKRKSI